MNIRQFRRVLEKVAVTHSRLGATEYASALRALAAALKAHDRTSVERFVEGVRNLRKTGGKVLRKKGESA
jgi:hypothetical protein